MQQKVEEKIDPLTRIQEEIKEVVRREEEYRQLVTLTSVSGGTPPVEVVEFETYTVQQDNGEEEQQQQQDRGILVTAQPVVAVQTTSLLVPIDEHSNTPDSLASSVNSTKEESLDGQHSDDSGISASSNNNNNKSNNGQVAKQPLKLTIVGRQEQRYIGPNCYNLTPEPPQQKLKAHTTITSTPHQQQKRQFAFNGIATKGVMQRFIASHGKVQQLGGGVGLGGPVTPIGLNTPTLAINNNNNNSTTIATNGTSTTTLKLNSRTALAFLENGGNTQTIGSNNINVNNNNITISSPTAIERDSEGRPLRRGYVPVEQKIQRELQDLKSRETELKRQRKLNRQNTLKASLDKLQLSTDDEADGEEDDDEDDEDSEVEHCYGPGKLRNAQSTLELDRDCNDQELAYKATGNRSLNAAVLIAANGNNNSNGSISVGLRPAMSLAQLCDLTPEEAPSSHRLIAQWESLIKKNAEGAAAPIEAII